MPSARSLELDIHRLPAHGETSSVSLPQAGLPRFAAGLAAAEGQVEARIVFGQVESVPVLEVHARTVATLVCQRCLQPLHLPLSSTSRVGLVVSMEQADRLPAEVEPVWAEGRKVDLGELVEEELLLALPLVPMHDRDDPQCVVVEEITAAEQRAAPDQDGDAPEVVQKPFAELGELLKRRKVKE